MIRSKGEPKAGIYVHVPFCSAICPYCDFAVTTGGRDRRRRFVDALILEITGWRGMESEYNRRGVDTIYFGGGTPSLLAGDELKRILAALASAVPVSETARIFLEANPEDITPESLRLFSDIGVHFLSLGVQSFDDSALKFLGRRHTGDQSRRAVRSALDAGFPIVSVDLIYGFSGLDLEGWRSNLDAAVDLSPQHLSCYQLTVHEGTPFFLQREAGSLSEISDSELATFFEATHRHLLGRGFAGYEISNFARSDEVHSLHNEKYWCHTPYLGIGPSSHSFDGRDRFWNERSLASWQEKVESGSGAIAGRERLTESDLVLEMLMLGFRRRSGVDLAAIESRTGVDLLEDNGELIAGFLRDGFVTRTEGCLAPTLRGFCIADTLARSFRWRGEVISDD